MLDINKLRNDYIAVTKRIKDRKKEYKELDTFLQIDTK
jgi:seryl-tRNA synthetase